MIRRYAREGAAAKMPFVSHPLMLPLEISDNREEWAGYARFWRNVIRQIQIKMRRPGWEKLWGLSLGVMG